MTTTMLATITAPPITIVHSGARIAANVAVMSHAHTNATLAISRRASCDTLAPAITAANASNTKALANTAEGPTQGVMAAAPSDPTDTASRSSSFSARKPLFEQSPQLSFNPDDRVPRALITEDIARYKNLPLGWARGLGTRFGSRPSATGSGVEARSSGL
jgi:hypothetical protein